MPCTPVTSLRILGNVSPGMDVNRTVKPSESSGATPRSDDGMAVLSYLLAGLLFYGVIGWLLGRWLNRPWLLAVGLIVGFVASVYLIVKRYGTSSSVSDKNQEDM